MTNRQTYRVRVRKTETYSIDLAADSEDAALGRAERLWYGRQRSRFDLVMGEEPARFEIDHVACDHLGEVANEDRARWAASALKAFSRETGTDMGGEALHDLLCDLGHYADELGLDIRTEMARAAETWDEEKAEQADTAKGDEA